MAGTNVELENLLGKNTDELGKQIGQFWDRWT